jgi:hypothetical protein
MKNVRRVRYFLSRIPRESYKNDIELKRFIIWNKKTSATDVSFQFQLNWISRLFDGIINNAITFFSAITRCNKIG